MPTTILSFAANEITLKWQEQYVSQALNQQAATTAPKGIVRGFTLATNVSALTVTVSSDPTRGDHAAGVLTSTGYVIAVRKTGDFTLDLTSFTNKTVVVAVAASYATNTTTAADLRVYQLSPSDEFTSATERSQLVVLGTVTVPASGTIPAANISNSYRTDSWESQGPGQVRPINLIRNGGFEYSIAETPDTGSHFTSGTFHWVRTGTSTASFVPSSANPADTGDVRNMVATYVSANGATTASLKQITDTAVRTGDLLTLRMKVRCLAVPTAGTFTANLNWVDTDGNAITATSWAVPLTAVDAAYKDVAHTFTVPANAVRLSYLELAVTGITLASSGTIFYLDDVSLWFEQRTAAKEVTLRDQYQSVMAPSLTLLPEATTGVSWATAIARALRMTLDATLTEPVVNARRRDGTTTNHPYLTWRGRAQLGIEKTDRLTANLELPAAGTSSANVSLLWSSYLSTDLTGIQARMYLDHNTRALFFTVNAVAQNNATLTWAKDSATVGAYKFTFGSRPNAGSAIDSTGVSGNAMPVMQYRDWSLSGTWLDTAWEVVMSAGESRWRAFSNSTTPTNVVPEYSVYLITTATAAQSVVLPDPATGLHTGRVVVVKDRSGAASTRNITITSSGTIAEGASIVISTNYGVARVFCDGTKWYQI